MPTIEVSPDITDKLVTMIEDWIDNQKHLTHEEFLAFKFVIQQCGIAPQPRSPGWERYFTYSRV